MDNIIDGLHCQGIFSKYHIHYTDGINQRLINIDFVETAYKFGCEIPTYVDHFGNTNMQEWLGIERELLGKEREQVIDDIYDEVVDNIQYDSDIVQTEDGNDNNNPYFIKNDYCPCSEMAKDVGEYDIFDDDMGENEAKDVDLPNILKCPKI
ncbi:unnamed protein product [Lactuca saligna]|uniref:Uncharacterized protein n=1 Tax=Lactuca saligna TaxID=75948 RepID=A0AA35YX38_LACSI|nr:unnamed protein product [Lactuca saligna]